MRWAELAPSDMGSLPPALTALVKCPPLEAGPNDWLWTDRVWPNNEMSPSWFAYERLRLPLASPLSPVLLMSFLWWSQMPYHDLPCERVIWLGIEGGLWLVVSEWLSSSLQQHTSNVMLLIGMYSPFHKQAFRGDCALGRGLVYGPGDTEALHDNHNEVDSVLVPILQLGRLSPRVEV